MKKAIILAVGALALSACSYEKGPNSAGSKAAPAYSYDGAFATIPAPKRLWESPQAIAKHFMGGHPEGGEGRPKFEIKFAEDDEGETRMLMTAMGYLDDSVRGEQWRLTLNYSGGSWGVVTAENRYMCQRGRNEGKWVTQPCP